MIRIFFSLADLARVRLVGPSGPEIESAFALAGWQKNTSGYFRMWHRTVLSGILRRTELQRLLQHFVDSGTTRDLISPEAGIETPGQEVTPMAMT